MRITKERLEEIVREEVNAYVLQEKLTDKEEKKRAKLKDELDDLEHKADNAILRSCGEMRLASKTRKVGWMQSKVLKALSSLVHGMNFVMEKMTVKSFKLQNGLKSFRTKSSKIEY